MPDGQVAGESGQHVHGEDLVDQPQAAVGAHPAAVPHHNAGGFLAPVLQGIEAEVGQPGRLGMAVDAEHAALLPGLVNAVVSSQDFGCQF